MEQIKENLQKVYNYCQFDSIQQVKLQQHTGVINQLIQQSSLTKVPFDKCVFNANGPKIDAIVSNAYYNQDLLNVNVVNPFSHMFNPNLKDYAILTGKVPKEQEQSSSEDETNDTIKQKDKAKSIRNIGGEVICAQPGFHKFISAVDAESMYPAQIEANNLDKAFIIKTENLIYMLNNKQLFNINNIKISQLYDMYSPYVHEKLNMDKFLDELDEDYSPYEQIDLLAYINEDKKSHRYQIDITRNNTKYTLQQFLFERVNQQVKYSYVFILQSINDKLVKSPKSIMLTNFRTKRKAAKQKMKDNRVFYDAQQQSIKLLMNSTYGQTDANFTSVGNMFEPSLITKCSRYIIQNCRDIITSEYLKIPQIE